MNTIASYAKKKFGKEYQGFLLRFCMHRNELNCIFESKKLRKYAINTQYAAISWAMSISGAMSYGLLRENLSLGFGTR